jgi:hypothetical protein
MKNKPEGKIHVGRAKLRWFDGVTDVQRLGIKRCMLTVRNRIAWIEVLRETDTRIGL